MKTKRNLSKVLAVVIILSTLLSTFTSNVFGATSKIFKTNTILQWGESHSLDNNLNLIESSQDMFLHWDLENINGTAVTTSKYTLTYPIENNKLVKFEIDKTSDNNATVKYSVNNPTIDDDNDPLTPSADDYTNKVDADKPLLVYKDNQGYITSTKANFPEIDPNVGIVFEAGQDVATKVEFKITKNAGFNFSYGGNILKFVWDNSGHMYFVTNGVLKGRVYPPKLEINNSGAISNSEIHISKGIDTENTFKATPFANKSGTSPTGKEIIDQSTRPITEYPGDDEVGITIKFDAPKEWNNTTFQYEPATTPKKKTTVIFDLLSNESSIQVKIDNIYTDMALTTLPTGVTAESKYDATTDTITLTIGKMQAGIIYKNSSISLEREPSTTAPIIPFRSVKSVIPFGKIYTFTKFRVVSLGDDDFYLKIEPYKSYNGFYRIYAGSLQSTIEKWIDHEEKNSGSANILVPVSLSVLNSQERFFKIGFSTEPPSDAPSYEPPFQSQFLKYIPNKSDVALYTPRNLEIIESNIIRESPTEENLFVTFKWDVGYKETIDELINQDPTANDLTVKYLFNKGLTPLAFDTPEFAGVNVILPKTGDIKEDTKYELPAHIDGTTNPYSVSIIGEKCSTTLREDTSTGVPRQIVVSTVTFKVPVSDKKDEKILQYPNIYFVEVNGKYTVSSKESKIASSLPVTLTLDGIANIEVPEPQNVDIPIKTVGVNEFIFNYDTLRYTEKTDVLYNYDNIMLKTIGKKLTDDSVTYDFYLTRDKQILDDMIEALKKGDTLPPNITKKIKTYDYNNTTPTNGIDINVKTLKDDTGTLLIDSLRDEQVIEIKNIKQNFTPEKQSINFDGLDENDTYYIIGRTYLTPYDVDDKELPDDKDSSKYSKIVTTTTKSIDDAPTDTEKIPTTPTNFEVQNVNVNSANLIWDRVVEINENGDNSTLEYQFIKTKGYRLDDTFLKSKNSYTKTWEDLSEIPYKEGIKTSTNEILEFDEKTNKFVATTDNKYEYQSYTGEQGNIFDKVLQPNQVYFYYIRTVRVVAGTDKAYSVWVPLSFTTDNITAPKNLRVEPNAEFDKKSEVVISFDIPKIDMELIGKEYNLQYSTRKDLENWSDNINMKKENITFVENPDNETLKVTYKITGLDSGSIYTIKVRMFNIILDSPSIYSNEVEYRTDTDTGDNDYDQDVDNWENNFKELINKLKNQSYWFVKNTTSATSVYYRPQYFDKIINDTSSGAIPLVQGIGSYKEYYMPASAVLKAFNSNKGFSITYNNSNVMFTSKSINPNTNQAILSILDELNSKDNKIQDYFVKIAVDFKNLSYNINGEPTISPSIHLASSIEATKTPIIEWDAKMLLFIEELLKTDEFSKDVNDQIGDLIQDNTSNTIMVQQVNKLVDRLTLVLSEKLARDINYITAHSTNMAILDGNVVINYTTPPGFTINGYRSVNGVWTSVPTSIYAGKTAIYTVQLSQYIFTAKKVIVNGLGTLPDADKITSIIIKYNLDDFLGINGNISLISNMTRHMAIGSLARIAGATTLQDPIQFFKSKNVIISNRNTTSNISSEELVYLVMKTYEIRSAKNIDHIKIRNYNLTSSIKNINNRYKKAIQVSFNLGIYNDPNMNPKAPINVQKFLQSISNMSNITNI